VKLEAKEILTKKTLKDVFEAQFGGGVRIGAGKFRWSPNAGVGAADGGCSPWVTG